MKIFALTPIYATTTSMQGATPVVHYFTKEWVKLGHEVTVFHFAAKYPRFFYWISKKFQHQLNTRLGLLVPIEGLIDDDYEAEGVTVHRRCLKKLKPHSRYSKRQLNYAIGCIEKECKKNGVPDWFIGHWDNPQMELLCELKRRFNKPICLVVHDNSFNYEIKYGKDWPFFLSQLDVIGFRSIVAKVAFEKKYGKPNRSFIAYSGVSSFFIETGMTTRKMVSQPVHNFVYVGSLIARKYPVAIITALATVYPDGNFKMTYIGDGAEKDTILAEHKRLGSKGEVCFTGRIARDEIIGFLKESDVFIMISRNEIFGLVYLEAMALGIIPVGSRGEGIDGVIRDGENGFLCEAGNVMELTNILEKIKKTPSNILEKMSCQAKETAQEYSDRGVAEKYIKSLTTWDL